MGEIIVEAPADARCVTHNFLCSISKLFGYCRIIQFTNQFYCALKHRNMAVVKWLVNVTIIFCADHALLNVVQHQIDDSNRVVRCLLKIGDSFAPNPQSKFWKTASWIELLGNNFAIGFSQRLQICLGKTSYQKQLIIIVELVQILNQRDQLQLFQRQQLFAQLRPTGSTRLWWHLPPLQENRK